MRKPTITVDLARRAAVLARPHYCYGNLRQHEAHTLEMRMSAWLGGGTEQVTCPGHATDDTEANLQTRIAAQSA